MCEDAVEFSPNFKMDHAFSTALKTAYQNGVNIIAYSFKNNFKKESLEIIPLRKVKISFKN